MDTTYIAWLLATIFISIIPLDLTGCPPCIPLSYALPSSALHIMGVSERWRLYFKNNGK